MVEHLHDRPQTQARPRTPYQDAVHLKACPDGHPDHRLVAVDDETISQLSLPRGALLHIDMQRRPRDGDVVLAELVIRERMTRTVRRYARIEGLVSLAPPAGRDGSIIRPRYEVGVLGVVDGHIVPIDGPQPDGS